MRCSDCGREIDGQRLALGCHYTGAAGRVTLCNDCGHTPGAARVRRPCGGGRRVVRMAEHIRVKQYHGETLSHHNFDV